MKRLQNYVRCPVRACGHSEPSVFFGSAEEAAADFARLKGEPCAACADALEEAVITYLRRVYHEEAA